MTTGNYQPYSRPVRCVMALAKASQYGSGNPFVESCRQQFDRKGFLSDKQLQVLENDNIHNGNIEKVTYNSPLTEAYQAASEKGIRPRKIEGATDGTEI